VSAMAKRVHRRFVSRDCPAYGRRYRIEMRAAEIVVWRLRSRRYYHFPLRFLVDAAVGQGERWKRDVAVTFADGTDAM